MSTTDIKLDVISPQDYAAMQEATLLAVSNVRDREVMRQACESMDKRREEIRRKHGILDISVPAIRELRGELPGQ